MDDQTARSILPAFLFASAAVLVLAGFVFMLVRGEVAVGIALIVAAGGDLLVALLVGRATSGTSR